MTDYPTINDTQTDPGAPITSVLMKGVVDQPLAMFEGSANAPRLALKAIERLVAGDDVRSQAIGLSIASGSTDQIIFSFSFIQIGTIRAEFTGNVDKQVSRIRGGASSIMASAGGVSPITVDVPVVPGDQIIFQGTTFGSAASGLNCSLKTDATNLWPGAAAILEGNDVS